MSVNIKNLQKDKTVFSVLAISMLGMLISFLFLVFSYHSLPVLVPLFNQLPWGTDRLISREGLYIPCVIAFVFLFCNIFFSAIFYEKMPLIARMIAITSMLVSFFVSYFLIRTILLVI